MNPPDCPGWEYADHPRRHEIVQRISELLSALVDGMDTDAVATDTREVHLKMFGGITPPGCDYYAGHYRGEPFPCLRFYRVAVQSDRRVGAPPEAVEFLMGELSVRIRKGIAALDAMPLLPPKERLRYIVALACQAFVDLLTVHPYANGNGHTGRFIVWTIMGRYGHWPQRWPVEPRPPDPPYTRLIIQCRNGDPEPLKQYLLQMLID